jgi:SPW repeat
MRTVHSSIDHHPDLLALRAGYERMAESMSAHVTFGLALLTGLYVAASPWIVGFGAMGQFIWCDLIAGSAIAILAFGFASALDRTHGVTWTLPVLGLWVAFSPWTLQGNTMTTGMVWSHVTAGAIVTFLGFIATYFGMHTRAEVTHSVASKVR